MAIPTSKAEMYEQLEEIYLEYRSINHTFGNMTLEPLNIERIDYTPKTEENLLEEARVLLQPWYNEEYEKKLSNLDTQYRVYYIKKQDLLSKETAEHEALGQNIEERTADLEKKALEHGFANTDLFMDAYAKITAQSINGHAKITSKYDDLRKEVTNKMTEIEEEKAGLEEKYQNYLSHKISAKIVELREEDKNHTIEVLKYNNGVEEKLQRSINTNISSNASLKLKFMEITSEGFSKDDLIQRGYYKKIINCVCDFYTYNFGTYGAAYTDILNEHNLMIYLEDYYVDVLELLRMRAHTEEEAI
ncbi:MAG: hypothetical protein IJW43_01980 [Clostridia bacterium]|nr:hypothetical protein [Clostridia bacterium]